MILSYETAGLTVHPPPPPPHKNGRGEFIFPYECLVVSGISDITSWIPIMCFCASLIKRNFDQFPVTWCIYHLFYPLKCLTEKLILVFYTIISNETILNCCWQFKFITFFTRIFLFVNLTIRFAKICRKPFGT